MRKLAMFKRTRAVGLLLLSVGMLFNAAAHAQDQPRFIVDYCVKVNAGKGADFGLFLHDVTTKMAQVGIDDGILAGFSIARAVSPLGSSARCDYHLYYHFDGWPPEPPTPQQTEATMKKAGLTMSRQDMVARRSEDSSLVSAVMWRGWASVGQAEKGSYLRLNFYKARPGMVGDWIRLESEGWKGLVEKAIEENPGIAWGAASLVMPGGTGLDYNAGTFDAFPDWAAYGKGIPLRATWMKAHPDQDVTEYLDRVNSTIDRVYVDVVKLIEVLRKK